MAKGDRLARKELRTYDRYTKAKEAGKAKKAGRLYDKLIDRQTKSIGSGVNVDYDTREYTIDEKKLGGMTGQDLNKIQAENVDKRIMFNVMKDAYDRRKKNRSVGTTQYPPFMFPPTTMKKGGSVKRMKMGGSCPKVIKGKSLR
jgi:hypothetical protein